MTDSVEGGTTMPERPALAAGEPAPVLAPVPTPGVITISRYLFGTSFLVGLMAMALAFMSRPTLLDSIGAVVVLTGTDRDEETLDTIGSIVFWGCLAALAAVVLIELLLFLSMMKRHGSVRWVLLLFLAVHAAVVVAVDGVFGDAQVAVFVRILVMVQLVLAGVALLFALLPGAWTWFRIGDEPEDRPQR